jgi:TrmH family RNA methyltransferase
VDLPISSLKNPRVKLLRSLHMRKYREQTGRYLVEGIRIVEEALETGAPVDAIVYAPDLLVSERARALIERVDVSKRLALSGDVFRTLSDRQDPQGIAAVVRIEERPLASIPLGGDLLVIVAHEIRDPGNLGALIRTADAVGASGIVVVEPSADVYDPQSVRATMGSLYALPIVRLAGEAALPPWYAHIRSLGLPLLVAASSAHADRVHFDLDYRGPVVLLLGSERHGLPQSMRDAADARVRLPMMGRATSLNVSAAAAALVYEIIRQRRTASQELVGEALLGS